MKVFKLFLVTTSLIYSHYGFTAEPKSNWNTVTTKDELTGKISAPFLIYKKKIQGSVLGDFQMKIRCGYGDEITIFDYASNLMKDLSNLDPYKAIASSSRTLSKNGQVETEFWIRSEQYNNVFYRGYVLVLMGIPLEKKFKNGSTEILKEEFIFQNGQKIIVEYDEVFSNYVQRCRILELFREF
jgi:hypothetical protein